MMVFGDEGIPIVLIPPGNCRFYDAKDHGLIDAVSGLLESGAIKIYCPDTADYLSWLNNNAHPSTRIKNHNSYENLLLSDVFDFAKFETGMNKVVLAGIGLGGYHAANTTLRHPDRIRALITMGGLFNIKEFLNGYYSDDVYFNNPVDYLPGLEDPWYLTRIKDINIILGTGEWDFNLQENYHLSGLLNSKEIPYNLNVRQNTGHDWHWWREMFAEYMFTLFGS